METNRFYTSSDDHAGYPLEELKTYLAPLYKENIHMHLIIYPPASELLRERLSLFPCIYTLSIQSGRRFQDVPFTLDPTLFNDINRTHRVEHVSINCRVANIEEIAPTFSSYPWVLIHAEVQDDAKRWLAQLCYFHQIAELRCVPQGFSQLVDLALATIPRCPRLRLLMLYDGMVFDDKVINLSLWNASQAVRIILILLSIQGKYPRALPIPKDMIRLLLSYLGSSM
jgi:hypothetical protein